MSEKEETEIEQYDDWTPPKPETHIEKFYARLALAWKNKAERENRIAKGKLLRIETELERAKADNEMEHQELISMRGEKKQLANEVDGLLRREMDMNKRLTAEHNSLLASVHKVEDVLAGTKPKTWMRLTWEIVAIASFFILVWQIGYNPDFRAWMGQYIFAVVLIAIFCAYIAFRLYRGKKGK